MHYQRIIWIDRELKNKYYWEFKNKIHKNTGTILAKANTIEEGIQLINITARAVVITSG